MFDANYGLAVAARRAATLNIPKLQRGDTEDPIIDRIRPIQTWLTKAVVPDEPGHVALLALAVIVIGTATTMLARRRRTTGLGASAD